MKIIITKFLIAGAILCATIIATAAQGPRVSSSGSTNVIAHPNCPPGWVWACSGARCMCVKGQLLR